MSESRPLSHTRITKILHWFSAAVVVFLFSLGLWMTRLDYYHSWYREAPLVHIGVGLLFILLLLTRLVNRLSTLRPAPLANHKPWERRVAHLTHALLYLLLVVMVISGYLLAGIEGQGVNFFDLLAMPGVHFDNAKVEDLLGDVHEVAAFCLIGLASVHAIAALKHHFWDKDATLKRMWRG